LQNQLQDLDTTG